MTEAAVIVVALAVIAFFAYHGFVLYRKDAKREQLIREHENIRKELKDEILNNHPNPERLKYLRRRRLSLEQDLGWD